MALEFETLTASGRFGDTCEVPIMDLRKVCNDNVLRNIDTFVGRWEDSTEQKVLTDENWEIAVSANDCDPSVATNEILECTVLLPDQKLVSIGFAELPYTETMRKFCKAKRINNFPTLFDTGGGFRDGEPLSDVFLMYLLSELRRPFMKHLQSSAWNGVQSTRHSFEGILPQLNNGPITAGGGCDLYKANTLDWGDLTGNPGVPTSPDATIEAADDTVTIQGVDFSGMTGKNFVEFLVLWLERLMEYDLAVWSDEQVTFELWVGRGQSNCILESAACMQPCTACVDPLSDPTIRERASDFIREKAFWLYPHSDVRIVLRTSPFLKSQAIFLPKTIGGSPTIGWVFRDQDEELGILNGELPMFGMDAGLVENTPLYDGRDEDLDRGDFEMMAFSTHLERNGNCIEVFLNTETAMLINSPQMWLLFSNLDCAGLIPVDCVDDISVAVEACADGAANQLDLDVTDLEVTLGFTPVAGDTFLVQFNDGLTQLIGTVISYTVGTEVLILDFGFAIVCTDFSGTFADGPATIALQSKNT